MSEIDRPDWCPQPTTCICLTGFDGKLCWGRLSRKEPHDPSGKDPEGGVEIYNTHMFGIDSMGCIPINDEDAYFFLVGFKLVRQDVIDNNLYRPPGWKNTWDF